MNKSDNKSLSIQVSLNGLSFCVKNTSQDSIEILYSTTFDKKEAPLKVLEHLESSLEKNSLITGKFHEVILIHRNEISTLVPEEYFDENLIADYLKFNAKILKSDYISHELIKSNNSINIYVPLMNINNFLVEKFGEITYKHSSTVLLEILHRKTLTEISPVVYINISHSIFEMVILKEGKLVLYNMFEFETPEDLSYYVLFSLEQLNLDVEKTAIRFLGGVTREDPNFEILYKYIRDVDIIHTEYKQDKSAQYSSQDFNNQFLLLNSFDS